MGKSFKILSIDGGGIKGLYSSTILEHFEEEFDCRISDHFDLLCGTSTGGLLALGLSRKIPAKELSKIYCEHGSKIFPRRKWYLSWLEYIESKFLGGKFFFGQTFFGGKYTNENLKTILYNIFGDDKIKDSQNLLCIPSFTITEARPWVFKYDHQQGPKHNHLVRDNQTSIVDVALATSAAPTYFPIHEIEHYNNTQFIDGGVWANNPGMVGIIEALRFFVGKGKEYDSIELLSISSLTKSKGKPTGWRKNRSFVGWRADLFNVFMDGQSQFNEYILETLSNINDIPIKYLRIPSAKIHTSQEKLIDLDISSNQSIDLMKCKGKEMGIDFGRNPELRIFFETLKSYKI